MRRLQHRLDDFEAVTIPRVAAIAYDHLQLFGLTRDVIYNPVQIQIPVGNAFARARATGIIQHNGRVLLPNQRVSLPLRDLSQQLSGLNFLSVMEDRRSQGVMTLLPIYMLYKENRAETWEKETLAWEITIPQGDVLMGRQEHLHAGLFTHQFMLPPYTGPSFPDAFLVNGSMFRYWYTGTGEMTFTASAATIGRDWLTLTRSYKDYVIFRSPFAYEVANT